MGTHLRSYLRRNMTIGTSHGKSEEEHDMAMSPKKLSEEEHDMADLVMANPCVKGSIRNE